MASPSPPGSICVHVKTPKNKETITTAANASVKEFKELVSAKFNAHPDNLCLIFSGKILKDEETLEQLSIKDDLTVHLVIKNNKESGQPARQEQPPPSSTPTTQSNVSQQQNPFGPGLSGLGGMSGLAALSGQNPQMIEQAQQHLMQNPELMSQLMNTPAVQGLMSNPDIFRDFFLNNSQMQGVLERNPEIGHVLNNPQLMRQAMEVARNPALMQEMMRNQDAALRNIESLPGGHSALRRLYSEVQEPMISAAQETMQPQDNTGGVQAGAPNPFSQLFQPPPVSQPQPGQAAPSVPQGTESTNPLPNPWAPPTSTAAPPNVGGLGGLGAGGLGAAPGAPGAMPAGLFQSPGLQSLMRQMQENPQLLQSAMQMPQMHEMMQQFATNPELMNLLITSNPLLANDPSLADQIRGQLPNIMTQMQNPEFQAAMTNPEVLAAMMQIQQGMQRLTMAAPGLLPGIGVASPYGQQQAGSPGRMPAPGQAGGRQNDAYIQSLMSQMVSSLSTGQGGQRPTLPGGLPTAPPTGNPELAYRAQLQQLGQMGFVDAHANLQALIATNGDLNSAIERLLNSREMT